MRRVHKFWLCVTVCIAICAVLIATRLYSVAAPAEAPWLYEEIWAVTRDRLTAAIIIGAALGISGVLLRTATANPLADPEITGVNSGAAFGAVALTFITSANQGALLLPGALLGATVAATLTVSLSMHGSSPGLSSASAVEKMVLLGVAISALFSAITAIFLVLDEAQLSTVLSWLSGRLAGIRWPDLLPAALALAVIAPFATVAGRAFDALSTGDGISRSIGADPATWRKIAIGAAVILTATCVAAAGPIGLLGLLSAVVAHRVGGHNHQLVIPAAATIGATVLLLADSIGQLLWAPAETPVGIVTSIAGVPLLLWGIRRMGKPSRGGSWR